MEILKKISLLIVAFTISINLSAQKTQEKLQEAFKNSYSYESRGDYVNAIKQIKNIYDDNSYDVNLRLGWLNYIAGNFTESISYYEKALKLMPMSEEARMGYVLPASALGNWDAVLNKYLEILKTNPYNTLVLYRVGLIYYGKEQYSQAYSYFEKVVNLYPFSYDGLLMFAWTNLKLGKNREAKALFNKVLLLSPDDTSAKEGLQSIK
ncbi:MAG TPA: tetratricopeptide repeat protein [Bacteroidales bacterium]|nr:tetratricopeptide repeat protein [Bacteroidales bacterium]